MTVHFVLVRRIEHARLDRVEEIGRFQVHRLRVTGIVGWMREAYRVGEQRHLVERPPGGERPVKESAGDAASAPVRFTRRAK